MTHTYTKKLAWLLTVSTLTLVMAACSSGQENRNFTASSGTPNSYIDDVLADQADLSMFYQSLLATGVAKELNNNTEYTIFAPTNAAFAQIKPRAYPCFYDVQCRPQVAAILRNHIVPRNESINRFSNWGGGIVTLGQRRIDVEEIYKGQYTVEGYRVLYQNESNDSTHIKGSKISLYRIDGVIASNQEMMPFRTAPFVAMPAGMMEKTVTTYRSPITSSYVPQAIMPNAYLVPGGYATNPVVYKDEYDDLSESTTETTTVTHTTTVK